ncbi:hypothetical protein [Streptomyces sp. NPDC017991]|uniref:hypothetical protein n=1 Tax=Streptomyces sp. NPDC017991 TaxID=3365026 RepID=UPI00378CD5BA
MPDVHGTDRLVVHPVPDGLPRNAAFSVKAIRPAATGTRCPSCGPAPGPVDERTGAAVVRSSSVACLDFTGTVQVEVTSSKGAIASARIRPLSYGIPYEVSGDTVGFVLTEPRDLSVEADLHDNLHLHANPY